MIIFDLYKMSSCLVSIRHKITDHDRIHGHPLKCFSAMNPHGLFFRAKVLDRGSEERVKEGPRRSQK
jgi:hypothetical protein